jgi:integrase
VRVNLPYLVIDRDRYGNVRYYFRRKGQKKIRIRFEPGDPEFLDAYNAAFDSVVPKPPPVARIAAAAPKTFGWLAARYFTECADYIGLVPKSRSARRSCIEDCLREPLEPGGADLLRDCPVDLIGPIHMKMLRDRKKGQPGAANNRRKHVSALMTWAVEEGLMKFNPMRDIKSVKRKVGGGYYTWTEADVRQYIAFYPLGTKQHLALALMLYTGARRQDMVTFGRQHVRGGWLRYVPKKTLYKRSDMSQKPWLPILAKIVEASPCGDLTFLVAEKGKPFTEAGFGNWFRDVCDKAGLPKCTAHGLKKAGATFAAEAGATTSQLMAMFDWTTISQAEVYTKAANRKRMAGDAMGLIEFADKKEQQSNS